MSEYTKRYDGNYRPGQDDLALLGEVISEWSEVEFWLKVIFQRLAGIEFNESLAVFANIRNWRAIAGVLKDLADQKMEATDAKKFRTLLERFDRHAAQRNGIVHATWYKLNSVDWCRYVIPADEAKIAKVLSISPRDQKIRDRHLFRPKDLKEFCAQAHCLQKDIGSFWDDWDHRQNPV